MRRSIILISAAISALAFCSVVSAQNAAPANQGAKPATAAKPAGPAPVKDISGVWNALPSRAHDGSSWSKGDPPMTAWGEQQFKSTIPSIGPRGVTLKETNDPVYKCFPSGTPYVYFNPFPIQIVQTPKEVIMLYEYDHTVRHIYIDGRKHPDDITPTYMGHSIGHWEGNDTLVVDTVGFNGKTWLDRVGHPLSDQMHLTERFKRVDANNLQLDLTFDDPKSYPKPWSSQMTFRLHPDWDIMEQICMDNRTFDDFEK
jgi:hypothetical protein